MNVYENILLDVKDGVAVVKINRPKAMNALNNALLSELKDIVSYIEETSEIRGAIITGEGKAFVAGADISQMQSYNSEQGRDYTAFAQGVFNKIEGSTKPFIAAVNGYALGGGCELALSCDFIIAGERAVFGQPEVNLGIIPCFGGTQRLSRYVGIGKAKEMIYAGEFVKADEAHRIGLVTQVVKQEGLLNEAISKMKLITSKAPLAIKYAKSAINKSYDLDLTNGLELEQNLVGLLFTTEDQKEGMSAFLSKREVSFKGC